MLAARGVSELRNIYVIERGYEGYVAKDEASAYKGGPTRRWLKVKQKGWTVEEDRLFVAVALGEGPEHVTAEDGYRATELVEVCYRAVRQDGPVRLPLPEPVPAGMG